MKLSQLNALRSSSSGLHVITYSNYNHAKGKFYQTTGYVTLPDVTSVVSSSSNRTRPYVMFGAYQDISPWGGFDAGLVYYKEKGNKGTWKLFFNGLNSGWAENADSKGIATNVAKKVYLQMYFQNNGYTTILVREPSTWTIIDQIDYYMGTSFNTNPSKIMITRETALAQDNRLNNGTKMRNTKWEQVYLYSNLITTTATSEYLLTNTGSNRWSYNNSYPKYIYGDEQSDKSYISITSPSYYYGETVSINI